MGKLPWVELLWHKRQGRVEHADEEKLSNFIKGELEDKLAAWGVILNREVEIRRPGLAGTGQVPDFKVDATSPEAGTRVSVVIEAKGCWHDEVYTAMETQLVERYLRDNQTRHGLYLVGWFGGDVCKDRDRQSVGIDEARVYFDEQAKALSTDGRVVRSVVLDCRLGS